MNFLSSGGCLCCAGAAANTAASSAAGVAWLKHPKTLQSGKNGSRDKVVKC